MSTTSRIREDSLIAYVPRPVRRQSPIFSERVGLGMTRTTEHLIVKGFSGLTF
jgi:hypothetical protein